MRLRELPGWTRPALAAALLAAAVALPRIPLPRETVDTLVVFDITQSMDVEDMTVEGVSASRLEYARASARHALRDLPCGSRVGWGAFTEYRTLVLLAPIEVCANYGDLLATLDNVDGAIRWGDSSEISKGVFWAMRASREMADHPALVFVTDGQEAPPLGEAAFPMFSDLKAGDVPGVLLGVGGAVPRPIPRTDPDGHRIGVWRAQDVIQSGNSTHEQLSQLKEPHLRALGTQTGLTYLAADGPDALLHALHAAGSRERGAVPTDLAAIPALAALGLLLAVLVAPMRRFRLRRA